MHKMQARPLILHAQPVTAMIWSPWSASTTKSPTTVILRSNSLRDAGGRHRMRWLRLRL